MLCMAMTFAYQEGIPFMITYLRQVALCGSVRKMIERAFERSDDMDLRRKINSIPTTESILRAVSLLPSLDDEDKLKVFMIDHALTDLRLSPVQKEQLNLNS
jgi:hypothetical protein